MKFFLALLIYTGSIHAAIPDIKPLPPHSTVAGKDLGVWAGHWWQWARGMGVTDDAIKDLSGIFGATGQEPEGKVWFLAGSYSQDKITRYCRIPAERHVFFPIINVCHWRYDPKMSQEELCAEAHKVVREWTTDTQELFLYINDKKVPDLDQHREESSACFKIPGKPKHQASASGYWIMLPPLPVGRHRLRFGALNLSFSQNIEYYLEVVPGNDLDPAQDETSEEEVKV